MLAKNADPRDRLPVLKYEICSVTNFVTLGKTLVHKRKRIIIILFFVSQLVKYKVINMYNHLNYS